MRLFGHIRRRRAQIAGPTGPIAMSGRVHPDKCAVVMPAVPIDVAMDLVIIMRRGIVAAPG